MYTRNSERIRALLGAQIVFNNQNSTLNCQVRNISTGGARISLSANVAIPEEFDLLVPQKGRTYRCKLRWRTGDAAGVEFLNSHSAAQSATPADRIRELEGENDDLRRQIQDLIDRLTNADDGKRNEVAA
jgi:hypothetical protein